MQIITFDQVANPHRIHIPEWGIQNLNGYKPITNYWQFSFLADMEYMTNANAIKEFYAQALNHAKADYMKLTELVLVLNHKIWFYHALTEESTVRNDMKVHFFELSHIYDKLWRRADKYAYDNLKGEELTYFYQTTD